MLLYNYYENKKVYKQTYVYKYIIIYYYNINIKSNKYIFLHIFIMNRFNSDYKSNKIDLFMNKVTEVNFINKPPNPNKFVYLVMLISFVYISYKKRFR